MDVIAQHIEALLFSANPSISKKEIQETISEVFEADIRLEKIDEYLSALQEKYDSEESVMTLVELANGYQMLTKAQYHNTIMTYLKQERNRKLSSSAMETLSIVAYKQPVTKTTLEEIRGVNCDYSVSKLLERELIEVVGRSDEIGKPILYGTSQKFLDFFGLKNKSELPQLEDIEIADNSIGTVQE